MSTTTLQRFLVFLFFSMIFLACKKGDTGAAGPVGPNGPTGAQGIQGPGGSQVLNGTGIPAATIGKAGDFYLDVSKSALYGPKTETGWGSSVSLIGPTGAQGATGATGSTGNSGANGSSILSGSGVPGAAKGKDADFYLDIATYNLYGPKIAGAWGVPTTLIGATGGTNVIYSAWKKAENFGDSTFDATTFKVAYLKAPDLTQAHLESALIQVYLDYGGGVMSLPYTAYPSFKPSTIAFIPKKGLIVITRITLDGSNSITLGTNINYRYVIVPGGVPAMVAKRIDFGKYETAMEILKTY